MLLCNATALALFQFTHPGGVRQNLLRFLPPSGLCFNSRTREGCDIRGISARGICFCCFNSRTREGCDGKDATDGSVSKEFQFTHPGGVRPKRRVPIVGLWEFQFTHPGGVRRHCAQSGRRGAQRFNSRTREGCDIELIAPDGFAYVFQFTHPGGVRHSNNNDNNGTATVSIHAPGRGATSSSARVRSYARVSIHAPGRGATTLRGYCPPVSRMFQFTHPGGVRPLLQRPMQRAWCGFNSRTREGCDYSPLNIVTSSFSVSIHAPGRGATQSAVAKRSPTLFQFTHPGGVRRACLDGGTIHH